MQMYETRIINAAGKAILISSASHLSDFVAIRTAQRMCRDGEVPEVWRDDQCIYAGTELSAKSLAR
jgi:hypothetical protein